MRLQQQIRFLRRQFLQDGDLPFTDSDQCMLDGPIYPPLVTLWGFLSQLLSADSSCRAAVAGLSVHRISRGEPGKNPRYIDTTFVVSNFVAFDFNEARE